MTVTRGLNLQYITLTYNSVEAVVAISAGALASSVSLVSFGLDSMVELLASLSALGLLFSWLSERRAQQLVAISLALLAVGTAWQALARENEAEKSAAGLVIASLSVVVMPWLAREKRKVAFALNSSALVSEAKQTDFCFYLSVILLAGMGTQWLWGWAWVDSAAALVMTPLMAIEAWKAWQGKGCGSASCGCH